MQTIHDWDFLNHQKLKKIKNNEKFINSQFYHKVNLLQIIKLKFDESLNMLIFL